MLLAHAHGLDVTVHHVNHGIRPDSHLDIDVIAPLVDKLGVPLIIHNASVEPGPNLEARARDARYALMPHDVMTGHTLDDQAETVLINLLRGAASQGLSAMRPSHRRPLLALRRTDTNELCREHDITPVADHTNDDMAFVRNRIRHEVLPLLNDVATRDVAPLLARTADVLRLDNDLLDELSLAIDPTDAKQLSTAPLPLAMRSIRRWLSDPYPPDVATVERVLSVARGEAPACDVGANREVRRSKQRMQLRKIG